ncbi:hypothetical protein [Pseudomonas saponiphila]|uniref:hypothetical protein n=1 Tax=Pseudomonas saponiphila TaxID=556534 RepID=UPI000B8A33FD|nr:hypothetical protein [Pseudomonas saponiphila]
MSLLPPPQHLQPLAPGWRNRWLSDLNRQPGKITQPGEIPSRHSENCSIRFDLCIHWRTMAPIIMSRETY